MKKTLCALLCALLICSAALVSAEGAPESEIVALEEGSVVAESVGEPVENAAPTEAPATEAPAAETVHIGFEDGFALDFPEGWLFHPTTEEMAAQGVVYCLSDAAGDGWLYVQSWDTDCTDLNELKALIDRVADIQTSGIYGFNNTDFVVYDLTEGDASCCASLLDGRVLNLVFTPQSDADFMATAAEILNSFELL